MATKRMLEPSIPVSSSPRILLLGSRRSGKSSIHRVVFHKMSPHETLFLDATSSLDIMYIDNNDFVRFQIWDFPGDVDFNDPIEYGDKTLSEEMIFRNCGAVVFVLDAQDEPYTEALDRLYDTARRAHAHNPEVTMEVFIHKVDGDLFLSDEHKAESQREIQKHITQELAEAGVDIKLRFFGTSIYDVSVFDAFSKVVQRLIPQQTTLTNILNTFTAKSVVEKAFLFDVVSKIYLASDTSPMEMQAYELCSDMIDVVVDVSCIYGVQDEHNVYAYDDKSASVIHLGGGAYDGMVLYLRQVGQFLALVCLVRLENFKKPGLLQYNVDVLKAALAKLFGKVRAAALRDDRGALVAGAIRR